MAKKAVGRLLPQWFLRFYGYFQRQAGTGRLYARSEAPWQVWKNMQQREEAAIAVANALTDES